MSLATLTLAARAVLPVVLQRRHATLILGSRSTGEVRASWADDPGVVALLAPELARRAEAEGITPLSLGQNPAHRRTFQRLAKRVASAHLCERVRAGDPAALVELAALCEDEIRSANNFAVLESMAGRIINDRGYVEDQVLDLIGQMYEEWTGRICGPHRAPVENPEALSYLVWRSARLRIIDKLDELGPIVAGTATVPSGGADTDGGSDGGFEGLIGPDPGANPEEVVVANQTTHDVLLGLVGLARAEKISWLDLALLFLAVFGVPHLPPRAGRASKHQDRADTLHRWRTTEGGFRRYLVDGFGLEPEKVAALVAKVEAALAAAPDPITANWVRQRLFQAGKLLAADETFNAWLRDLL